VEKTLLDWGKVFLCSEGQPHAQATGLATPQPCWTTEPAVLRSLLWRVMLQSCACHHLSTKSYKTVFQDGAICAFRTKVHATDLIFAIIILKCSSICIFIQLSLLSLT
jgi:hypothetical protein